MYNDAIMSRKETLRRKQMKFIKIVQKNNIASGISKDATQNIGKWLSPNPDFETKRLIARKSGLVWKNTKTTQKSEKVENDLNVELVMNNLMDTLKIIE